MSEIDEERASGAEAALKEAYTDLGVAARAIVALEDNIQVLLSKNAALLEALKEIAKGEGPFSRDQLTHAQNCIEYMKEQALAAIAAAEAPS